MLTLFEAWKLVSVLLTAFAVPCKKTEPTKLPRRIELPVMSMVPTDLAAMVEGAEPPQAAA